MTAKHKGISVHTVRFILERYGCRRGRWWAVACLYCGGFGTVDWTRDPPDLHGLSFDHVLSRARGGTSEITNLTIACRPCNLLKGGGFLPIGLRDTNRAHPLA